MLREAIPIQDPTHTGTKARSRFLRQMKPIVIGNYTATPVHLQELIEKILVTEHGRSSLDLNSYDTMKFKHARNICSSRVLSCVGKNILKQDNRGSIAYLELMQDIIETFLNRELNPVDRLIKIWRSVVFCRIWRANILKSKTLSLTKNFLTSNLYQCIELNAHGLINIITVIREKEISECFLPWLFGSH